MINSPYSPMAQYEMQFTPLLPSQLLVGSPFQPGTPGMTQFATFPGSAPPPHPGYPNGAGGQPNGSHLHHQPSPDQQHHQYPAYIPQQYYSIDEAAAVAAAAQRSRTVYLGNIPNETTAEELLNHVRSGVIESVKLVPEKNCAFVSFLDASCAAHFHSDAILKNLSINGNDVKVGWGKSSPIPTSISMAVSQDGASRNVYLGALPDDISESDIREELEKYGAIDTIKLVRDKNIGFVHFLTIATAVKVVQNLQFDNPEKWQNRKIFYGKDRCAYISKTQQQNAAQYLGISPGYEHILANADRGMLSSALAQQSAAAIAVATSAGGASNAGNRTVYLGNVHPETTIEEICNVVRGGLLHTIRYIPEKHICFVTFVDPTAAAQFFAMANLHGLAIHNRRLKVGWGKHSGALPNAVALAVTNGASRNVYIGNIAENWPETKLRHDFSEFGEIEQINFLPEKSCAFVNFTNITNAIKAIEGIKQKGDYRQFKINFGKDRCGNPPRQLQQMMMRPGSGGENPASGSSSPSSSSRAEFGADNMANGGGGYYYDHKFGFGMATNTPGSAVLAQYLAQAQHDHYMYAAAAAAAAAAGNEYGHHMDNGEQYYGDEQQDEEGESDEDDNDDKQEQEQEQEQENKKKKKLKEHEHEHDDEKNSKQDGKKGVNGGSEDKTEVKKDKQSEDKEDNMENKKSAAPKVYGLAIDSSG